MWRSILVVCTLTFGCSEYGLEAFEEQPEELTEETSPPVAGEDCVDNQTDFDIEEVSTLQDAFGLPSVRDGLTLEVHPSYAQGENSWRPVGVAVLVMYPSWYFNYYDDSNTVSVSIYDSANPVSSTPYTVSKRITRSDLSWAPLTLPYNAHWSADSLEQVASWVHFDFSELTPEEGFATHRYFVAVEWDGMGFPNVGYSNFELACQQNWTDYGSGSWTQNTGNDCSWPMFKIDVETRSFGECD